MGSLGKQQKRMCFLCGVFSGLYRVMLQVSGGRVTDRAKLCILVCGGLSFLIGFAWLKLLLALVCACKSVQGPPDPAQITCVVFDL